MTPTSASASSRPARLRPQTGIRRAGSPAGAQPNAGERLTGQGLPAAADGQLPQAENILIVTARPGQESTELGGLLYAFRHMGASLMLLSLTRGEASPLNSTCQPLEAVRPWELQLAASVLGISSVAVANYRDGALSHYPMAELVEQVRRAIREHAPDLLLVIDPAAGDPDDAVVAEATCIAARQAGVPVVARTGPAAPGASMIDLGADAAAARAVQRSATAAHVSQSRMLPQVEHRLAWPEDREHLRWLVSRHQSAAERPDPHTPVPGTVRRLVSTDDKPAPA